MKKRIALGLLCSIALTSHALAGWTTTNPFSGVSYSALRGTDVHGILGWSYSHLDVDVMEIKLAQPSISFTSTPSNGSDPYDTTLQTTMDFMNATNTEIAINTNFYGTFSPNADNVGLVVSDSNLVSSFSTGWPAVNISPTKQIELLTSYTGNQYAYGNAFAGSDIIVQNGQLTGNGQLSHATSRHPRTAVGYNAVLNKLILMTVDGRRSDSIGVTNNELGKLMKAFDATWAINLDGGGSTQMTMNNGTAHYVNTPSDTYRAVGANFGVHAVADNSYMAFANFEHNNFANFEYSPGYSGSSTGFNESLSTTEIVTSDVAVGQGAMKLTITDDAYQTNEWFARLVSGSYATRSQNTIRIADGYVGVWAKTTDTDAYISIALDDPTTGDRGIRKAITADGNWHLYEWNIDDATAWESWVNNTNGQIDGSDFTMDSIQIWGKGDTVVYLDNLAHDTDGSLSYLTGYSVASGLSISSNQIPEPASLCLISISILAMTNRRRRS
ncbi:phosphodiester glycosidase family protein [Poriferisphaera corsica]|nr:phosphodiester glycosidase family protein [Poriferisphaera corsica]